MPWLRRVMLSHWPVADRVAMVGATIALFGSFFVAASWGSIVLPVQRAFAMSADVEILLRQLPDIAGLLVVLGIGAFGASVSGSRLLAVAAGFVLVGATLAIAAPAQGWLLLGMSLMNVGRSVVGVAAFASVGAAISDEGRRTTAFATLGAVAPVAFITGPVLAGWLLGLGNWRFVGSCWLVGALLIGLASWLSRMPATRPADPGPRKEPWTPILGGITLVGVVQALGAVTLHGALSLAALSWTSVTVAAAAAWFGLCRSLPSPTVDGRTLRVPGLLPILLVAMIGQCGDLWFYVGAIARFVHRLTPLQVSLALLAAQVASFGGACLGGWLIRRIGLCRSGTLLLAVYAAAMFASCVQAVDQPLWIAIGVLCVAAVAELGSGVCFAQAIMSCATKGLDRQVSSYRSAAMGIGNALTVLLVASSVGHTMVQAIRHEAELRQASPRTSDMLAQAIRDNVPTGVIGRELDLTPEQIEELRTIRSEVMVAGFRTHGWVSGMVLAVAAVGFWVVQRRREQVAGAG